MNKELDPASTGQWDSVHVFEVTIPAQGAHSAHYKVTSTIMLGLGKGVGLKVPHEESNVKASSNQDGIELAGSLQRQVSLACLDHEKRSYLWLKMVP